MNPGCFSSDELSFIEANKGMPYHDVPPRLEPDKYDYISTDKERRRFEPQLGSDEVWALRHFWMPLSMGVHRDRSFFSGCSQGCHYRRKKRSHNYEQPT